MCPNQAPRKEEEVPRDAFIFTRLFYRFQVATQCCHGEIVLTAYEKDTQNSGRPAVFSFFAHRDDLHPEIVSVGKDLDSDLVFSPCPLHFETANVFRCAHVG